MLAETTAAKELRADEAAWRERAWVLVPPALAAGLAGLGLLLGWRGVDWAAAVYREGLFRRDGLVLWNSQWYGGHWTLGYSVLLPAVAATLGLPAVAVLGAAASALGFDRVSLRGFGAASGRAASLVFAASTVVETSIGQLPFLLGETFGLLACWAISRHRWWAAAALGLLSTLSSPLAGAFLALAAAAYGLSRWPRRRLASAGVIAVAIGPIGVTALLFPGAGPMPYPLQDWLWELAIAGAIWLLARRADPALRVGAVLFAVAATLSFAVASPLGGNVGRIEDVAALPLAVGLCWPGRRLLMVGAGMPLLLSQWVPAWGAMTSDGAQPAAQRSFYTPLLAELRRLGTRSGRVEVVPTRWHWESDYVASEVPIARGWERQVDESRDPLFYEPGALTPASYRAWLLHDGVTYVALPAAPLDWGAVAEGRLVAAGVPGLALVWSDADWQLYAVQGSQGIVGAPGQLVSEGGDSAVVRVSRAGVVVLRVRYEAAWRITAGTGCVERAPGGWIALRAPGAEVLRLHLSLLGALKPACTGGARSGAAGAARGRRGAAARSHTRPG